MKKVFYLSIISMLVSASAQAQSFTMQRDTVSTELKDHQIDQYNYIRNTSGSSIQVQWRIISHNLPQDWVDSAKWGLCDNITCYDNATLGGVTRTTDPIPAGDSCLFKGQLEGSSPAVTSKGEFYYTAELTQGTTTDTVTFVVFEWNTNISSISGNQNDVTIYPNPAKDILNVQYDKNAGIRNISIHNLVGKQVASFRVNGSGNSVKLDINNIPSGVYFLRLKDNTGRVTATRRFTHQ